MLRFSLFATTALLACLLTGVAMAEAPEAADPITLKVKGGLWEGLRSAQPAGFQPQKPLSECLAGETADLTVESFVLSRIVPEGTQCTIAKQDAITDYFLMTQIHCTGDSFTYGEIVINGGPESLNAYADLSMGPDATEGPAGVVMISLERKGDCPAAQAQN